MHVRFEEVAVMEHAKAMARELGDRFAPVDPHGTLAPIVVAIETMIDAFLDGATALEVSHWPEAERRRFWSALGGGAGEGG